MSEEVLLRPSRFLSHEEFAEYVRLARRVARFDRARRAWAVDPVVIRRNFSSAGEAMSALRELSKFVAMPREVWDRLSRMVSDAFADALIALSEGALVMVARRRLPNDVYESIRRYVRYVGGRTFRVRSPVLLGDLCDALEAHGIAYRPGRAELEALRARLLRCTVAREGGRLVVRLPVSDEVAAERLAEACTLRYFIERAVLDEEGNFVETVREERKLRLLSAAGGGTEFAMPVGLLDRVVSELRALSYDVEVEIQERPDIPYDIEPRFELMPHQKVAYKLWLEKRRGTIAIFTRGGKSFIAMRAICDLRKPTLILVTTRELASTWMTYLAKYLGLSRGQVGYLGEGRREVRPVTVAIYNSCVKHVDLVRDKFELLICDECHHVPARTFKRVVEEVDALYRMALSATPRRRDGNEELLFALCGPLVINLDYEALLSLRIVAPIEVFEARFASGEEEKLRELVSVLERHRGEKTIVFTQYVSTAERVYAHLIKSGFRAALITGSTPSSRRRRAFNDFLRGYVNVIVATTVLDEGITVPDAEVAVIYEGSGEARQMIQRIGRVLGYVPGKTAKIYEIVDVTNPKEKRAYFRRKWVRELYMVPKLKEFVEREKRGVGPPPPGKFTYQARLSVGA